MAIDVDRMRTVMQRAPLLPRGVIAALGLGVAFGAGLVVGGSGQARAVDCEQTRDMLVLARNRSAALDDTRAKLKLSYASELLRPDPSEPRRPPSPRVVPAASLRSEEGATPLQTPPALVEPPVVAQPPRAVPDELQVVEDVQKRSGDDLKAALARVVDDLKPVAGFSLQVAAAATQAGADDVKKKLAAQGHSTRIIEGQVGGQPVFRVRVGAFSERAQAVAYQQKLPMPTFIVNE